MIENLALAERRSRIRALLITGLVLLFVGLAAIAVFVLVNVEKTGEVEDFYTYVFIGGMLLTIGSFFAFFHSVRVSRIYCKNCGTKFDFTHDVDFQGNFRRRILLYTVRARFRCRCSKCKNIKEFSRFIIHIQDMTLNADLKEAKESCRGYFD